MPKENPSSSSISWLTPRRRRTTGNLKHVPNGQVNTVAANANANGAGRGSAEGAPLSPTIDEVAVTSERPSVSSRAISQPVVPVATNGEGNLFYAYARKVGHD